jgi:hypothetical protein
MRYLLTITVAVTCLSAQVPSSNKAVAVEHAVPFGTVPGKILLLGNALVFYDDQQPESSFVVPRSAVESITAEGPVITLQAREAVKSRSGEVRRLSFRVPPGGDPAPVTAWFATTPSTMAGGSGLVTTPTPAPASTGAARASDATASYQVIHDKRIGSSTGRLMVNDEMLSYESISDVKASRRWEYRSIKEIRQPNPYELEVKPFEGDAYKFKLEGSGMDPAAYKKLVDRVTAARTGK